MLLGAQLYTVRQFTQTEKDFTETIERVADMGYKTVQLSAIGNIAPPRLRQICDSRGLQIVLTHTSPDRILNDTEAVIEEHNILGCDYIGIGSMPERYRYSCWVDRFALDFKEAAQKISAAGKLMMYHNHDFEFAKIGNKRIIDYIIEGFTAQEMGFTLDTYWLQYAGCDIYDWINRLAGRLPCVHLKDMDMISVNGSREAVMAPVMEGNMNFPAILKAFEQAGTKYILVEQDICRESPFDCLKKSFNNVSALGYK